MRQKIFNIFIKFITLILIFFNNIFVKVFKRDHFLTIIHDNVQKKLYNSVKIRDRNIKFFCPSKKSLMRVKTFYTKEPETLKWIESFETINQSKIIFWDIGANMGLYSIYASLIHPNIDVISFEPSTSNTRLLSRNISINSLFNRIRIFPLALNDKKNIFSLFNETDFQEGGAISTFDKNINSIGAKLDESLVENKYKLFGTTIDYLIDNELIEAPNYIKIDVDGIEHLILKGASKLMDRDGLKELLIEMNPTNTEQTEFIYRLFKEKGFKKIISTNANLTNNKNYILKQNENVNTIFRKI